MSILLEVLENRLAPAISEGLPEPPDVPLAAAIRSFDAVSGTLSLLGDAETDAVRISVSGSGGLVIADDRRFASSDPRDPSYDPALAGLSALSLARIEFRGGGGADSLTFDDLFLPGTLDISSDVPLTFEGTLLTPGPVRATAPSIAVQGLIQTLDVTLTATGPIEVRAGASVLAMGGTIRLSADSAVSNLGLINADGPTGGRVDIRARSVIQAGAITADAWSGDAGAVRVDISTSFIETTAGRISASTTAWGARGGDVRIEGGPEANVFSSGPVVAVGQRGGDVGILGRTVRLVGATVDVSGIDGGGVARIGGDFHGANAAVFRHAETVDITDTTILRADALSLGNGGRIVVWSGETTRFAGQITARGGPAGGDGGLVEVSSADLMHYAGSGDAAAPVGRPGQLLLDPKNLIIDDALGVFPQYQLLDPNPNSGNQFGSKVASLTNGNVVVASPNDDAGASNAGAVYVFNGLTGVLISTLIGSTSDDNVGNNGVTALGTDNFVISSTKWDNGTATNAGAVTFGNGSTGVSGVVSAANSLVGTLNGNSVGGFGVTLLTNGNYVVSSGLWDDGKSNNVGAVTFGNGMTGVTGTVSSANSLVGSSTDDEVGRGAVRPLTNGNYVVFSPVWDNGAVTNVGAVTFGNGSTGVSGVVSAANSLVGSTSEDQVGNFGVTALSNGNYVVSSPHWNNGTATDAGAATFGDGTTGITGVVSSSNSLVGSKSNDHVSISSGGVVALTNGNYVVISSDWDNGTKTDAGAATFGNGTTGVTGIISSTNSLVGSSSGDEVGSKGVAALSNGNYVVRSPNWSGIGAATFGNGSTGVSGTVSAANSLVGSTSGDQVGSAVTALTNGNYVVSSPSWNNGTATDAGAATFGNGTTGVVGAVSAANSLVGSKSNDRVGIGIGSGTSSVTVLSNGNYVVKSGEWNNGSISDAGAMTFGNGSTGVVGVVSVANSLVGSSSGDLFSAEVEALTNGNYVIKALLWDNGSTIDAGAVTFGSGTTGVAGVISAANSLVGSATGDLESSSVATLTNGNYVVLSPKWDNGATTDAGAATWADGTTGSTSDGMSAISAVNSLVGDAVPSSASLSVTTDTFNHTFLASFPNTAGGRVIVGLDSLDLNRLTYSRAIDRTMTVRSGVLTKTLNTGTAVTLQASNDITISSPITVNNPSGVGGALTFQAGRSLLINASITTDGGNLTLIANDLLANGVSDANRDAGNAVITMASGTTIDAGTGTVSVQLRAGTGLTNSASGAITLRSVVASAITIANAGPTTGSDVSVDSLDAGSGAITIGATQGSVQELGSDAAVDLKASTLAITAAAGIGDSGALETQVGMVEAATTAGGIALANTGSLAIGDVTGSLMGLSAPGSISLSSDTGVSQTESIAAAGLQLLGTGVFTLTHAANDVATLAASASGAMELTYLDADDLVIGSVSLAGVMTHGIATGGASVSVTSVGMTVDQVISTTPGSGGVQVIVGAVTLNATPQVGAGNITLNGGGATETDLIVNTPIIQDGTPILLMATRDIIISTTVQTTTSGNITLIADSDNNGVGGVWIQDVGLVDSAGNVTLRGSDLFDSNDPGQSGVWVSADSTPTADQIKAAGSILIDFNVFAPAVADVLLQGVVRSTGAGPVDLKAKDTLRVGTDVFASNGPIRFYAPTTLVGSTTVNAGSGAITFDGKLDGGFALTLNGTGTTTLGGAVGGTTALASLTTNAGGTTAINGGAITTTGDQSYGDAVTLGSSATLNAGTAGNVTFSNTVTGTNVGLTLASARDVMFHNAVGTGTGNISVTAARTIVLNGANADLTTTSGNITLSANTAGTASGNFIGIDVNGAAITSTGGTVSLTGQGGNDAGGSQSGVVVRNDGQVSGVTTQVRGTGGAGGSSFNIGVFVDGTGSRIGSGGGNVAVTGSGGGAGTSAANYGVRVQASGTIAAGVGGTTTVTGTGGTGSGDGQNGVYLSGGATITSSGGAVGVTGAGGSGSGHFLYGVLVNGGGTRITSGGGSVSVAGLGGSGTGSSTTNIGVIAESGGTIGSGSGATTDVTGTGGTGTGGFHHGVSVTDSGSQITSGGGAIRVTGAGGSTHGIGVRMESGGIISGPAAQDVTLRGTGTGGKADIGWDSLTLSKTGGTYTFVDTVEATSGLTFNAGSYDVRFLDGGTVAGASAFDFTGTLRLSDASGASPKTLNTGNLALASGVTYAPVLGGAGGGQFDRINVTGTVTLTNTPLLASIGAGFVPPALSQYTLIDNDGTDAVSGTFAGLAEGATVPIGGSLFTISYQGGTDNNDVVLITQPLTVTIEQASGQADPTNASTIHFTVVFSVPVSDFATGDVTLGGTAGATTAVVSGSGTTYDVAVSGMTADGTVTASIAAGMAKNSIGIANSASSSTDNSVTYDATAPQVTDLLVRFGSRTVSVLSLNRALPWINIDAIQIVFSENVTVTQTNLSLTGINVASYSTNGFSYTAGSRTAAWTLPTALDVDRLMLALDGHTASGVKDAAGNLLAGGDFLKTLKILPGDYSGDGVVTSADVVGVRNEMPGFGTPPTVFGDLNGDGVVDINDYNAAKRKVGTRLPS